MEDIRESSTLLGAVSFDKLLCVVIALRTVWERKLKSDLTKEGEKRKGVAFEKKSLEK